MPELPVVWEMNRGDPVSAAESRGQMLEIPSGGILQPQTPQHRSLGHYLRDYFSRRDVLTHQESAMGPCDCHQPQHAPPYGQPQTYRPQRQTPFQQPLSQQGLCESVAQKFGMTWQQFCQCARCGSARRASRSRAHGRTYARRRRPISSRTYMMRRAPYAHGAYRPRGPRVGHGVDEYGQPYYQPVGSRRRHYYGGATGRTRAEAERAAHGYAPRRRRRPISSRTYMMRRAPYAHGAYRPRRRTARSPAYYEQLRARYGGRPRKPTRAHPYRGRHIFTAEDRELARLARSERYLPDTEGTQF